MNNPSIITLARGVFNSFCNRKLLLLIALFSISICQAVGQTNSGFIVTGKITDRKGEVIFASVLEKGTGNGTNTDNSGRFSISLQKANSVIVISATGFQNVEREVNAGDYISVELDLSPKELDQVVVVGFGTQKKASLTGAVSMVKGDDISKRTTSNIQQSLQGKLPGLTVLDQGAAPGKSNMVMRIRGITTIGANEPLVIVDGIEQKINDINPQDIESISVLKDASSTAIYGSRAANGVILVTTQRAKRGKLNIDYSGYYAWQKSNNNPEHMELEAYMRLQNVAWTNSSGSPIYTEDQIREYVNATDRIKYPLPNVWHSVVLHTAPQTSHTISLSGGNEVVKSRLSVRYQYQDGIVNNTDAKTVDVRWNNDYKVSKNIDVSADVNYRNINSRGPWNEFILFKSLLQNTQFTVPRYPDGTYGVSSDGRSPLVSADLEGVNTNLESYLTGNLKGTWRILNGLNFSTQIGARSTQFSQKSHRNSFQINDYYNPAVVRLSQPINSITERRDIENEYTVTSLLTYSKNIQDHSINLLGGYSQIGNKVSNLSAFRQNFYNNDILSIGQGANDPTKDNGGSEFTWGLRSYFSRLNYSFRNKYLFEANARYDGSSRFVSENRYSFFPSFSAGWRVSQEKFWDNLNDIISDFKIRGSVGKTGNQAVGLYSYMKTLSLVTYSFNGVASQGYRQTTLANRDLTWETTTQSNIGIDMQLLGGKISFNADYYYKKTEGILLSLPIPGTLGLLPSPQNAGRMDNKGWELLAGVNTDWGKVGINGNVYLTINDNKVVNLAGTGPYITGGNETRYTTAEGLPINSYWGYTTDGYFQSEEEVAAYPTIMAGIKPGDVKFIDLNKDGRINAADMVYLGRSFPKYTFGSNLGLTFNRFSLNVLFQGASGYYARVGGALAEMGIWGSFAHKIVTDNYWTPENRNARFPRPLKFNNRNINMAERDLIDGSYLRLKNVQLQYQLSQSVVKKMGVQAINIYAATTNLLTFSKLNDFNVDPETVPGGRTEAYPQTTLTTIGLNVKF